MVLPDSHGVSRVPRYSGTRRAAFDFRYGTFTLYGHASQHVPLSNHGSLMQALQPRPLESDRFGLIPFRSPLLWESLLISSPPGTEMFHFPGFATPSLCVQQGVNRTLLRLGFPIRTSASQSLFGGSSRLIAAYRVLHRLSAPRHPPVALSILILKNNYIHSLFNCQRSLRNRFVRPSNSWWR